MIHCLIATTLLIALTGTVASAQGFIDRRTGDNNAERDRARRAAMQAAQGEVDRTQATLEAARARHRATWKANPDLLAAERELAAKQEVYDKARQPILVSLRNKPEYQAAVAQASQADQTVKQQQTIAAPATQPTDLPTTLPAPPTDTQVQAATEKLEQKSVLRDMEERAIAADPAATAARADLDAARQKVKALQLQFDASVLNDPEVRAAFEQLQTAKSNLTAAAAAQ